MHELKQGTPLQGGKYIIKKKLGQGGFGITYLAEQVSLGREVTIKEFFMKDSCLRNDETGQVTVPTTGSAGIVEQFRKKFLKEARMLASLDHPHIISVIDVFEENGTVYYSMPYMPNGTLNSLIKLRGYLTESDAMRYFSQIAKALYYMHGKHLCHYDIKPDNILLDGKDNAVLIDFGISKNYDDQGHETSTTPIGNSDGYAPIEQYQGIGEFSPVSDIYALGATCYKMLTGNKPKNASEVLENGLDIAELVKNGVSLSVIHAIQKAMAPIKKNRYQSVKDFLTDMNISYSLDSENSNINDNFYDESTSETITGEEDQVPSAEDLYNKNSQDEIDLRQLVDDLIETEDYKEAYKICLQYIKDNRCKAVAQQLSQELVPLMKKKNKKQNRTQVIIVIVVTLVITILSILLNSLR